MTLPAYYDKEFTSSWRTARPEYDHNISDAMRAKVEELRSKSPWLWACERYMERASAAMVAVGRRKR